MGLRHRFGPAAMLLAVALALVPTTPFAENWVYTVVDGDSLWAISERYLDRVDRYEALRRMNDVREPTRMPPGRLLRIPMDWIASNPVSAELLAAAGEVSLRRSDGTLLTAPAPGTSIELGDRLRTAAAASATVRFADGSRFTLQENGLLAFDRLSAHGRTGMVDSRLRLIEGRGEARVEPAVGPGSRFELHTPAAVSAVRGTRYRSGADAEGARFEVLEGRVAVAASGVEAELGAGFGTRVPGGGAPLAPRALLDAPVLEALPEPVRRATPRLAWNALAGATGYRIELAPDLEFETSLFDQIVAATQTLTLPPLADGAYAVRLRGIDDLGLEGLSATLRFTVDTRLRAPALLGPESGVVLRAGVPELRWETLPDVERYRLQIARDAGFEDLLVDREAVPASPLSEGELTAPGTYHWRVLAVGPDGEPGPPGEARQWQLLPLPQAPHPRVETGDGDAVQLRWAPVTGAIGYELELAEDADFERLRLQQAVQAPGLTLPGEDHPVAYLRVRAIAADGAPGPWSAPQRIDGVSHRGAWWVVVLGLLGLLL